MHHAPRFTAGEPLSARKLARLKESIDIQDIALRPDPRRSYLHPFQVYKAPIDRDNPNPETDWRTVCIHTGTLNQWIVSGTTRTMFNKRVRVAEIEIPEDADGYCVGIACADLRPLAARYLSTIENKSTWPDYSAPFYTPGGTIYQDCPQSIIASENGADFIGATAPLWRAGITPEQWAAGFAAVYYGAISEIGLADYQDTFRNPPYGPTPGVVPSIAHNIGQGIEGIDSETDEPFKQRTTSSIGDARIIHNTEDDLMLPQGETNWNQAQQWHWFYEQFILLAKITADVEKKKLTIRQKRFTDLTLLHAALSDSRKTVKHIQNVSGFYSEDGTPFLADGYGEPRETPPWEWVFSDFEINRAGYKFLERDGFDTAPLIADGDNFIDGLAGTLKEIPAKEIDW